MKDNEKNKFYRGELIKKISSKNVKITTINYNSINRINKAVLKDFQDRISQRDNNGSAIHKALTKKFK